MPAPGANPNLAPGLGGYLRKNAKFAYGAGALGGLFLAGDIKGILDADNKLKALLKTAKDFVLIRVAMVGVFTAVAAAVKSLVRDTGALDAALKKLNQMQVFSRQLQGFVGGLNAARQRISQLAVLSERGPFKFEELAIANKNLEMFTRGAYSSVQATKEVGEAAIATGNNIGDVAETVGVFYDNLRNGQPVRQTTEQMRQMGLITQATADQLSEMSDGGEEATTVLNKLTDALKQTGEGAAGYTDELASITAEQEKAAAVLKEKFAMPFTAQEAQNAQNYTAAMKGLTPTIGRIGQSMATVYTGFGTATSSVAKFLGTTKTGHAILSQTAYLLEVLTVAAVAFGTYAAFQLTPTIWKMGEAFTKMGTLAATATWAVRGAALVGIWGTVLSAVGGVIGVFINLSRQAKQAQKDFQDWSTAQDQTTKAILAQVAAIQTLTDKNAALANIMDRRLGIQKEINALEDKAKHEPGGKKEEVGGTQRFFRRLIDVPRTWRIATGQPEKAEKIDEQKKKKLQAEDEVAARAAKSATQADIVNKQLVEDEAKRRFEIEQTTKSIAQRDSEAKAGLKAQADYETGIANIEEQRIARQKNLEATREAFKARDKRTPEQTRQYLDATEASETKITDLMKQRQDLALKAPEFSATYLEAKAEQLRQADEAKRAQADLNELDRTGADNEKKREAEIRLNRARTLAGGVAADPAAKYAAEVAAAAAKKREAGPPGPEATRQAQVQRFQIETDIKAHQARRRGDIAGAQIQEDIADFTRNFESLRPALGAQTGASVALAKTQDDIAQQYTDAQKVVSSMTAIGGGGGVSGVNPQLESAKRRESIQQEILNILSGASPKTETEQALTFAP